MDDLATIFSFNNLPGHLSYLLIAVSYWMTRIFWLRLVAVVGLSLEIVYFLLSGGDLRAVSGSDGATFRPGRRIEAKLDCTLPATGGRHLEMEELSRAREIHGATVDQDPFDPGLHEAVQQVESDDAAGTVVTELAPGYRLDTKLLRAAMVAVARPRVAKAPEPADGGGGSDGAQQAPQN